MTFAFNWQGLLTYLLARLSESTTWAGFVAILSAGGITIRPDLAAHIGAAGSSVVGLILIFMNEKKSPKP